MKENDIESRKFDDVVNVTIDNLIIIYRRPGSRYESRYYCFYRSYNLKPDIEFQDD